MRTAGGACCISLLLRASCFQGLGDNPSTESILKPAIAERREGGAGGPPAGLPGWHHARGRRQRLLGRAHAAQAAARELPALAVRCARPGWASSASVCLSILAGPCVKDPLLHLHDMSHSSIVVVIPEQQLMSGPLLIKGVRHSSPFFACHSMTAFAFGLLRSSLLWDSKIIDTCQFPWTRCAFDRAGLAY